WERISFLKISLNTQQILPILSENSQKFLITHRNSKMSQLLSPQYYESLELFKNKRLGPEKTIEETKHVMDDLALPIPDNIIVNEIKLDERYRNKSKEYLENGLKKYEDVVDE
ncbi:6961_t:CDS:1, partial [Funneliformis mosseae]